jgi:hypothetical protein
MYTLTQNLKENQQDKIPESAVGADGRVKCSMPPSHLNSNFRIIQCWI